MLTSILIALAALIVNAWISAKPKRFPNQNSDAYRIICGMFVFGVMLYQGITHCRDTGLLCDGPSMPRLVTAAAATLSIWLVSWRIGKEAGLRIEETARQS